jgi:hypothetical protein
MSNQPNVSNDPLDSAENPQVRSAEFWGSVMINTWYCVLTKGVGKVSFDPQQHSVDKRCTAIDISILPITDQNITYAVERGMIAESREWAGIVLPSIKALGLTVRELNNKWIHAVLEPTGRTYINKSGETKANSTFKFVKLFASEAEAKADYLQIGQTTAVNNVAPWQDDRPITATPSQVQPDGKTADVKEKETAKKFLTVLVKKSGGDPAKLGPMITQYPPVAKFFTVDSPEVTAEILGYLSSQPA